MTSTFKTSMFSAVAAAMVITLPLSVQAETFAPDAESELSQTSGMDRRDDCRDDRQDCRVTQGAVGQDKRDCKQDGRNG